MGKKLETAFFLHFFAYFKRIWGLKGFVWLLDLGLWYTVDLVWTV
jgi:hypothetical protein